MVNRFGNLLSLPGYLIYKQYPIHYHVMYYCIIEKTAAAEPFVIPECLKNTNRFLDGIPNAFRLRNVAVGHLFASKRE